jgi:hypothetical protein
VDRVHRGLDGSLVAGDMNAPIEITLGGAWRLFRQMRRQTRTRHKAASAAADFSANGAVESTRATNDVRT